MNTVVSIIVPIYNVEQYISRCIESIQAQTLQEIELILVDDGSTDRSGNIADDYAERDPRIRVVHQPNVGPSSARNKGLAFATGQYVGFVDPDDWVEPEMYASMFNAALHTDKIVDIVICNIAIEKNNLVPIIIEHQLTHNQIINTNDIKYNIFIPVFIRETIDHNGFYSMCNKLYRRKYITDHSLYLNDFTFGEDYLFNLSAFEYANYIVGVKQHYYHYDKNRPESLSKSLPANYLTFTEYIYNKKISYIETLFNGDKLYSDMLADINKSYLTRRVLYVCNSINNSHAELTYDIFRKTIDIAVINASKKHSFSNWFSIIVFWLIAHNLFRLSYLLLLLRYKIAFIDKTD